MDRKLLYRYFTGQATPEEEKTIMDWADTSPENFQVYLKEKKVWNALLVNTDLREVSTSSAPKRTINLWMLSTIVASVALLLILFKPFHVEKKEEMKWQSVWVPPGQRAQVLLDDGTKVWINSRSSLTFPSSFDTDKRIVELNGEGFFDVEKKDQRPFIVKTSKHVVKVLGTRFNVLAYNDYEIFETSLLNGSVLVCSSEINRPEIVLEPNQKVTETTKGLQVTSISNFDHFRWTEGLICLDDERFEDLMSKFSLYFDIKITISNKQLLDYRCTGKFRQSDGIDYALKVLQAKLKFTYQHNTELNEIIIK